MSPGFQENRDDKSALQGRKSPLQTQNRPWLLDVSTDIPPRCLYRGESFRAEAGASGVRKLNRRAFSLELEDDSLPATPIHPFSAP